MWECARRRCLWLINQISISSHERWLKLCGWWKKHQRQHKLCTGSCWILGEFLILILQFSTHLSEQCWWKTGPMHDIRFVRKWHRDGTIRLAAWHPVHTKVRNCLPINVASWCCYCRSWPQKRWRTILCHANQMVPVGDKCSSPEVIHIQVWSNISWQCAYLLAKFQCAWV